MRALIFTLDRNWIGIARLPRALHVAGIEVGCLCDPASYIAQSRFVDRCLPLTVARPGEVMLRELLAAIADWRPDRIIGGDEPSVRFLHRVATLGATGKLGTLSPDALRIFRASLGDPSRYEATVSKLATQAAAVTLGVRVPEYRSIEDAREALEFGDVHGYPIVLKKAFGTGGSGVRICTDRAMLEREANLFLHVPRPASLAGEARTAMRSHALLPGLKRLVRNVIEHRNPIAHPDDDRGISVQRYIRGTAAMQAITAHEGRVVGALTGLKLTLSPALVGPASIMKFVDRPDMSADVATMVQYYGYNGFAGFDYTIEDGTNLAYMIECNPRPVPASHLGPLVGVDLCGAWREALSGGRPTPARITRELTVTLFPQELRRDPVHPNLATDLHDLPNDDPALLAALNALVQREAAA